MYVNLRKNLSPVLFIKSISYAYFSVTPWSRIGRTHASIHTTVCIYEYTLACTIKASQHNNKPNSHNNNDNNNSNIHQTATAIIQTATEIMLTNTKRRGA